MNKILKPRWFWRGYQFLLQSLVTWPYSLTTIQNKVRMENVRTAYNTMEFWDETHSRGPAHLVDVGARDSEWSYWLARRWPDMQVDSFEPDKAHIPIGKTHRFGLSDAGEGSIVLPMNTYPSEVVRFDKLPDFEVIKPAILKVDCEEFTPKALAGFGDRLKEFDMVVCEMWNHVDDRDAQSEIWKIMLSSGFCHARLVDVITFPRSWPLYEMAFSKVRPEKRRVSAST